MTGRAAREQEDRNSRRSTYGLHCCVQITHNARIVHAYDVLGWDVRGF